MPTGSTRIPGWKPPQGAGVAVADLSGDGRPDVVVLAADRYRVGRSLDANGAISGGWGPWVKVPDWRFGEIADAGIAIAGGDLVVFAIERSRPLPRGPQPRRRRRRHRRLDRVDRDPGLQRRRAATSRWPTSTATGRPS